MFLDLISQTLFFLLVLCESVLFNEGFSTELLFQAIRRSVGRGPVCWAGGRGFKPLPDKHSGSLHNSEESAAFIMTSSNGYTF